MILSLLAGADITIGIAHRIIHIDIGRACIRAIIPIPVHDATVCGLMFFRMQESSRLHEEHGVLSAPVGLVLFTKSYLHPLEVAFFQAGKLTGRLSSGRELAGGRR